MSSLVALAALLVAAVTVVGAFAALRWQARAYDRKEQMYLGKIDTLLDRTSYAIGQPWNLAPIHEPPPVRDDIPPEHSRRVPIIYRDAETMVDPNVYMDVPEAELV